MIEATYIHTIKSMFSIYRFLFDRYSDMKKLRHSKWKCSELVAVASFSNGQILISYSCGVHRSPTVCSFIRQKRGGDEKSSQLLLTCANEQKKVTKPKRLKTCSRKITLINCW
ncbi:unnamed protein product [Clavelina lepadiformis]|uniref:Uncharacterized protein n=1 Tax=Clavelina lepadiformis TaxID=159417 RepID=A0ABP0FPH1_CLALP